ncbi:hypothetical protein KVF89_14100 [Nocardioides carbamazepini]|uniref:hypothetical protein n=1 Tax=Nocardioides carbamazepini TaxID=2854259 RepID=UPI00214A35CA|nr:hypothetical protein [Nocardioides carbamazepini]MCR1783669.1 hypothetical protein [Nocardioides carbamazepini]
MSVIAVGHHGLTVGDPDRTERMLVDDLDDVLARAAGLGWRPAGRVMGITTGPRAGGRAVHLTDDDGVVVELVEPPVPTPADA